MKLLFLQLFTFSRKQTGHDNSCVSQNKNRKKYVIFMKFDFFKLFKYKKIKKNDVICSIYFYRDKLHCFLGTRVNPENQFACQMSY